MIENLVLGLYAPIVFFSCYAVWMLVVRLLLPAFSSRRLDLGTYAIAISACLSLLAHALENSWYGVIRWNDGLAFMSNMWLVVGFWKLIILASSFFAVLALRERAPTKQDVANLVGLGCSLWLLFATAAIWWS